MGEAKFTLGPWKAHSVGERYFKGDEIFEIHFGNDGECVCEIVHGKDDAKLIAAAPEMYNLLKSILDLQKKWYGYGTDLHLDMISKAQEIDLLLKKARGEK